MIKRRRGRPKKPPVDDIALRRAILLSCVAHLTETGVAKTVSHACRKLAAREFRESGDEWRAYAEENSIRRPLAIFLEDEHKNARRPSDSEKQAGQSSRAEELAEFALFRVRLRSPGATRADAVAWLLNAHEYYLEKLSCK